MRDTNEKFTSVMSNYMINMQILQTIEGTGINQNSVTIAHGNFRHTKISGAILYATLPKGALAPVIDHGIQRSYSNSSI